MVDLPKLVSRVPSETVRSRSDPSVSRIDRAEAQVQVYCLILDECISFGTLGRTGRGLTELYNVTVCVS